MIDETKIREALIRSWSIKSSSLWTEANPARGQCGVTALVIQDHFGGEIRKSRLPDGEWHYYNQINGRRFDFTDSQFPTLPTYEDRPSTRDEALADTNEEQYRYLSIALAEALT
jgi:hypothetical protein